MSPIVASDVICNKSKILYHLKLVFLIKIYKLGFYMAKLYKDKPLSFICKGVATNLVGASKQHRKLGSKGTKLS